MSVACGLDNDLHEGERGGDYLPSFMNRVTVKLETLCALNTLHV